MENSGEELEGENFLLPRGRLRYVFNSFPKFHDSVVA